LEKPLPAYEGDDDYVFVCYAHSNADIVYADLKDLHAAGINLWYDEGISAGKSWRAEIATAIAGTSKLLFFISEASLKSAHCLREVDYALNHDIDIVPVYLEDCVLPAELELGLNRVHALFRQTDARYLEHLVSALREETPAAPLHALKQAGKRGLASKMVWVALLILVAVTWTQKDRLFPGSNIGSTSSSAPSAFDGYLEGLQLMERWDKGDNLEEATRLFREVIELDPDFALAYARLADALRIRYALTGDTQWLDEAAKFVNEALRLNPDLSAVQVALGRVQGMQGNIDLAFAAFQQALSIDPNDAVAHESIAGIYARQGRFEDAEASYQKALALEPNRLTILSSYANFLSDQTRHDESIQQYRKVIRLAPDHYAALVNMAAVLAESGNMSEAIVIYQRANEIRPSYMGYSNLGTAFARVERYEEAVDAYKSAIQIDDTDWLAWGNLGFTYSYMSENAALIAESFETAIRLAEEARQSSPRDSYVHSDLALYYAQTGQSELALERVETALALDGENGEILVAAAETYEKVGQRERAIEMLREALDSGMTRQRLQRIPALVDLLEDPRLQDL
jgi:tetratricopeptide (TPR) repeat protein